LSVVSLSYNNNNEKALIERRKHCTLAV